MKSSIVLFGILFVYFVIVGVMYVIWNAISTGVVEWAGTVALFLAAGLGGMIAVYLYLVKRKQGGVLIEDLPESDIDDGDPEAGEFSPWSWWPILLAGALSFFILGFCIGFNFWMVYLAAPFIVIAMVGWVYEYYRGYFAR